MSVIFPQCRSHRGRRMNIWYMGVHPGDGPLSSAANGTHFQDMRRNDEVWAYVTRVKKLLGVGLLCGVNLMALWKSCVSIETQKAEVARDCGRWKDGQMEPRGCLGKEAICVVLILIHVLRHCLYPWDAPQVDSRVTVVAKCSWYVIVRHWLHPGLMFTLGEAGYGEDTGIDKASIS